ITNMDLHDMARSGRTYGASDLFVVHPVAAQRQLAERIQHHWLYGSGQRRIPDRAPPMALLRIVSSLEEAFEAMGGRDNLEVWVTSARDVGASCSTGQARQRLWQQGPPVMLLLGTGWGLAKNLINSADLCLEPLRAATETGFNHLSVRAACAILLDRLMGQRMDDADRLSTT
ncbi:MAG TPA: RNA methyltransferase, partial [Polyangiaceae bacterium]|nr:RNA methyltransferase [Polyangiaceae bacterium]